MFSLPLTQQSLVPGPRIERGSNASKAPIISIILTRNRKKHSNVYSWVPIRLHLAAERLLYAVLVATSGYDPES